MTDESNIELGASYARGHNDVGSDFTTNLYGIDVTYRWRPLRRAIYRSFAARTELMWSHRNELLFQVLFTIGAHGAHPF